MSKKFTSTVAGASILLTGVGLLSRGLGLIREVVFAGSFGLGEEFDIYLVGAVLPLTIQVIILYLIQNFLIPSYNQIVTKNPEQKESFIKSNFWIFSIAGLILALILYYASGLIINLYLSGSSVEKQNAAKLIFNIFLLILPFNAANSVLISFLQNEFNFLKPVIARLATNIAVIIIVLLLSKVFGTIIIPIGYLLGEVIQLIILTYKIDIKLFTLTDTLIVGRHLRNSLSLDFILIIIIEALSQLYTVCDRYFIKSVQEGGIAALNYAQTLFVLPLTTISVAISTAIFPKLSQEYYSGSFNELKKSLYSGFRINILLFVPIMVVFFLNGEEFVKLIFQRGKFDHSDTLMTAEVLKYFSISIIFFSNYTILNKMIYSAKLLKILLIITVLGIAIKIIFNYLLVGSLYQNGLALSSSISYIFFFTVGLIILIKKLSFLEPMFILKELILHLTCAAISYIITFVVYSILSLENGLYSLLLPLTFLVIYFLNLGLLNVQSLNLVLNMFPLHRRITKL